MCLYVISYLLLLYRHVIVSLCYKNKLHQYYFLLGLGLFVKKLYQGTNVFSLLLHLLTLGAGAALYCNRQCSCFFLSLYRISID